MLDGDAIATILSRSSLIISRFSSSILLEAKKGPAYTTRRSLCTVYTRRIFPRVPSSSASVCAESLESISKLNIAQLLSGSSNDRSKGKGVLTSIRADNCEDGEWKRSVIALLPETEKKNREGLSVGRVTPVAEGRKIEI